MAKTTWGIQLEDEFIDIQKLTDGDMTLINEIKTDIMKIENILQILNSTFMTVMQKVNI